LIFSLFISLIIIQEDIDDVDSWPHFNFS